MTFAFDVAEAVKYSHLPGRCGLPEVCQKVCLGQVSLPVCLSGFGRTPRIIYIQLVSIIRLRVVSSFRQRTYLRLTCSWQIQNSQIESTRLLFKLNLPAATNKCRCFDVHLPRRVVGPHMIDGAAHLLRALPERLEVAVIYACNVLAPDEHRRPVGKETTTSRAGSGPSRRPKPNDFHLGRRFV